MLNLDSDITLLENSIANVNEKLKEASEKFFNQDFNLKITYDTPKVIINEKIIDLKLQKQRLQNLLDDDESAPELSLYTQQKSVITLKAAIVEKADAKEKEDQKYLADLKQWEITKLNLVGTETTEGTVTVIRLNKIGTGDCTKGQ